MLDQRTINSSLHLTGAFKLGLSHVVSVVLSEDGTEIDEDELLVPFARKPLLRRMAKRGAVRQLQLMVYDIEIMLPIFFQWRLTQIANDFHLTRRRPRLKLNVSLDTIVYTGNNFTEWRTLRKKHYRGNW